MVQKSRPSVTTACVIRRLHEIIRLSNLHTPGITYPQLPKLSGDRFHAFGFFQPPVVHVPNGSGTVCKKSDDLIHKGAGQQHDNNHTDFLVPKTRKVTRHHNWVPITYRQGHCCIRHGTTVYVDTVKPIRTRSAGPD